MGEATERPGRVRAWDRARACAVIGEAVWWVTLVDATLVRHHPRAYDAALAGQPSAERTVIEGTLAGLRLSVTRSAAEPLLLSSWPRVRLAWRQPKDASRAGYGSGRR